jgi:hypothetical protein
MTDSEIVATYSDHALACLIAELTRTKQCRGRLEAAKIEAAKRKHHESQQDTESEQ